MSVAAVPAATSAAPARRAVGRPSGQSKSRGRILDAAELLFAEHGFPACSIRMIGERAKVNGALVHHYFGSKDDLFVEVYLRRATPIAQRRHDLLDAAEREAGDRPVPLEKLIRCFIEPPLRLASEGPGGRAFVRIQARLQSARTDVAARLRSRVYDESTFRFMRAFERTLPRHPAEVICWRMVFMVSVFVGVNSRNGRLESLSGGKCDSRDVDTAIEQAVAFLVGGFLAPAPAAR